MLVLVYVGAVMVLFLFVVMMLDINVEELREGFTRYCRSACSSRVVMVVEMSADRRARDACAVDVRRRAAAARPAMSATPTWLGSVAVHPVRVCRSSSRRVILLVAIVAAISLTMRQRAGLKLQNPADQVAVRARTACASSRWMRRVDQPPMPRQETRHDRP